MCGPWCGRVECLFSVHPSLDTSEALGKAGGRVDAMAACLGGGLRCHVC